MNKDKINYKEEFSKLKDKCVIKYKSLHSVIEVDNFSEQLDIPEGWTQIFYNDDEVINDYISYESAETKSISCEGETCSFFDENQKLRTKIRILKTPYSTLPSEKNIQYILKTMALLHELGHVEDHENQINFNLITKKVDLIKSEIYANIDCYTECNRKKYRNVLLWLQYLLCKNKDKPILKEVTKKMIKHGYIKKVDIKLLRDII